MFGPKRPKVPNGPKRPGRPNRPAILGRNVFFLGRKNCLGRNVWYPHLSMTSQDMCGFSFSKIKVRFLVILKIGNL